MIIPSRRILLKLDGEYLEFIARPKQGAWYEIREEPHRPARVGEVGMLMMPMLVDGEPDLGALCEIEVPYVQSWDG